MTTNKKLISELRSSKFFDQAKKREEESNRKKPKNSIKYLVDLSLILFFKFVLRYDNAKNIVISVKILLHKNFYIGHGTNFLSIRVLSIITTLVFC